MGCDGDGDGGARPRIPAPSTLHPVPCTLHPTSTLHLVGKLRTSGASPAKSVLPYGIWSQSASPVLL